MRIRISQILSMAVLAGSFAMSGRAAAQGDLNRPAPNVMLLVDTSGSMEFRSSRDGCSDPESPCFPICYDAGLTGEDDPNSHQKSRWIELIEVLTGSIHDYSCWAQDRSTTDFKNEFLLGTDVTPYDYGYGRPYHRPQSNLCTPGPGVAPADTSPYDFPNGAIGYHPFNTSTSSVDPNTNCTTFQQSADGLLDAYNGRIRFGLMTFDTHTDPSTGLSGTTADWEAGVKGAWSYYLDSTACPSTSSTTYCSGKPADCSTEFPMEVGARNAAAPPWEGRMVAFGPPDATAAELNTRNRWIQDILVATRPYGATPIAGMLNDAREFFWEDDSNDPLNPGEKFGPNSDPLVLEGSDCRGNYIILLSDGEPNLDLRPYCANAGLTINGVCPYDDPADIARALANPAGNDPVVRTYVVGFAVNEVDPDNDGNPTPCEDLAETSFCSNETLLASNRDLKACCTLNEIAFEGTPIDLQGNPNEIDHAIFADGPEGLRSAFSQIFEDISEEVTSRTLPVFSAATGSTASTFARSFEFTSGVQLGEFSLWKGVLQRTRFRCNDDNEPEEVEIDIESGDDFIENVQSAPLERRFHTVIPEQDSVSGNRFPERSIRPHIGTNVDGVGNYSGQATDPTGVPPTTLVSEVDPDTLGIDGSSCPDLSNVDDCRDRYLEWLVGLDNGTNFHRCPTAGDDDCSLIGDIFHSTPQIRGKPQEFVRDEAYTAFARIHNQRDTVLYTSSNDGFFHAFKVAPGATGGGEVDNRENNELWAFVPPAVWPSVPSMYPDTRLPLLDGVPVVKDVVATSDDVNNPTFERTLSLAQGEGGTFRTIMISGFGEMRGGYFALDLTEPTVDNADTDTGPKFLWQLTTDADGNPLFGSSGTTPVITTVFMDTGEVDQPIREVAVAILPGGDGGLVTATTGCAGGEHLDTLPTTEAQPREDLRCYDADSRPARSLTIVRLDTGEIIRSFRAVAHPGIDDDRELVIDIPAPIVGEPAVYPAETGAVADRAFVGDRDGRLWRIDLSNTDPDEWTMEVFFDAYAGVSDNDAAQPIVTAPILSVDPNGDITVAVSTGDQSVLTATADMTSYVVSLTEKFDATEFKAEINWRETFTGGERVTGPMTLFSETLFFSSFAPGGGDVCEIGSSRVWGLHYTEEEDDGDIDSGGAPRLPDPDAPTGAPITNFDPEDGVVFGVGVRQQPTCTIDTDTIDQDPVLGFGATTTSSAANPGNFELVVQLGGTSQGGGGPKKVNTQAYQLNRPKSMVTIDSWAAIVE
jgi:type IV pilus assembly protein PilY1